MTPTTTIATLTVIGALLAVFLLLVGVGWLALWLSSVDFTGGDWSGLGSDEPSSDDRDAPYGVD